jgi:hypothetical protein
MGLPLADRGHRQKGSAPVRLRRRVGCSLVSPEAWIALIGVLGTLFGTLFGQRLSNRAAAQREERQWQRQQRETRRREVLEACQTYAELTMLMSIGAIEGVEVLMRAYVGVELLGNKSLTEAANELYTATREVEKLYAAANEEPHEVQRKLREARAVFVDVHADFIDKVQEASKEA